MTSATDNRTAELLPCPICGGQPDFQHFNITPNVQGRIICSCGIELRQGKNDTDDDMRVIWNTRSDYAVQVENERKPEQAIAATLGSEREERLEKLVHIYGEIANYFCERFACCDAEFANCKYCIGLPKGGQCELGWCNDESRALGIKQPDYGGGECEPVNLQELYDRIGELEHEVAEYWGEGEGNDER